MLWKCVCMLNHFWQSPTVWTHQAPLSMGFSRQNYWSGFLCPPPGNLPAVFLHETSGEAGRGIMAWHLPGYWSEAGGSKATGWGVPYH